MEDEIKTMIARFACITAIKNEHTLHMDLGMDSLDIVELSFMLEDKYKVCLDDAAFVLLDTVQQVIDYIANLVSMDAKKS